MPNQPLGPRPLTDPEAGWALVLLSGVGNQSTTQLEPVALNNAVLGQLMAAGFQGQFFSNITEFQAALAASENPLPITAFGAPEGFRYMLVSTSQEVAVGEIMTIRVDAYDDYRLYGTQTQGPTIPVEDGTTYPVLYSMSGEIELQMLQPATQADIEAGTDEQKPTTAKAVKDWVAAQGYGEGEGGGFTAATTTETITGVNTTKGTTPDALAALWEKGSNVASASSTALGEGGFIYITGSATINSLTFSTTKSGRGALLRATGAPTFVHSANLVCPGSANITLAAGDMISIIQDDSGVMLVTGVTPAAGVDALIKAFAALTTVAGGRLQFTGTDTVAVVKTAEYATTGISGSVTLNCNNGLVQKMTMSGNITDFNPPSNPPGETTYGEWIFRQDASTGNKTVVLDAAIKLEGSAFEGGWAGPETGVNVETIYPYKIGPSGVYYVLDRAVRW